MRALRIALLAATAALTAAAPGAQAALVKRSLSFKADDGAILHATIGGDGRLARRPLIIEDSPYAPGCCNAFAGAGYNYIELDWRGTGQSGGLWTTTGARDQRDLAEFAGWACRQPWSDGRIGLYGFSASAIVVYNSMRLHLPCVRAAALMAGSVDLYRDLFYIGGVPNTGPGLVVFGAISGSWLEDLPPRLQLQPASVLPSAFGYVGPVPLVAIHPTEDAYWRERTFGGDRDHIPILADSSFYDVEPRGPFLAYRATRRYGSHLLVLGAHDGFPAGTSAFPQYKRWFDRYVRGIRNGIDREPAVSLYLSDGSRERLATGHYTRLSGRNWPLPGTRWRRLYLSPAVAHSARSLNDGTLADGAPGPRSRQSYPFVFSDSFSTDVHTSSVVLPPSASGLTQMALAEPISLTYTSAPLQRAWNAAGPGSLDLFASSTAAETDIVAVIADVWPDGTAHPVATGQLRTTFPNVIRSRSLIDPATGELVQPYTDFSSKSGLAPGTTREYHVELLPIGNRFAAGHRVRLYLVGTSAFMLQSTPPALDTVSLGGVTPSRLVLPVAPGSG